MHGEYKVPGGKLVVADVEIVDDHLSEVHLSGDFFLEPDDALERIDRALQGLPANADTATIAARVDAQLDAAVTMIGFSTQAVAIAVKRALAQATDWHDHEWRLIHQPPQAPPLHMALDEVLAGEVAAGHRPPTLRVWEWSSSAVIIGSFQSLRNEVDADGLARHGAQVVRRISGGGAMFVEPGNTITYSLYAPASLVQGMSFTDSYAFLDEWVLAALQELGLTVWYQPINDIASEGGKIAGAAQKRLSSGAVLHHVTMSYDIDAGKMSDVLRVGQEKLSGKGITSAKRRVDPLRRQTGLPRAEIIERMVGSFRARYGLTEDAPTGDELRRAEDLVSSKFDTAEWTARVP